jgi:hypothetical protein
MKITEVIITIEPNESEITSGFKKILLMRNSHKIWNVQEGDVFRGLFPSEIRLANFIQENVIYKYNTRGE